MTTARDLITLALKESGVLGVGQTALAEDMNDGYTYLRRMLATWQVKRWMVPALVDYHIIATGAKSYTVGPGGNFAIIPRPREIKGGYFIQLNTGSNPVSLPLSPVFAYEDYIRITVKDLNSLPDIFFYDNAWSGGLGNIYFWPIPSNQYEMHILVQANLAFPSVLGIDTVFTLPEEYEEAIHYNLAVRYCSGWTLPVRPVTQALAKAGRKLIQSNNAQIPELQMPAGLRRGKAFSIYNPDGY